MSKFRLKYESLLLDAPFVSIHVIPSPSIKFPLLSRNRVSISRTADTFTLKLSVLLSAGVKPNFPTPQFLADPVAVREQPKNSIGVTQALYSPPLLGVS